MNITPVQAETIRQIASLLCVRKCGLRGHDKEDLCQELVTVAISRLKKIEFLKSSLEDFVYFTLDRELRKACARTRKRTTLESTTNDMSGVMDYRNPERKDQLDQDAEIHALRVEILNLPAPLRNAVEILLKSNSKNDLKRDYYNEKRAIQLLRCRFRRRNLL